MTKKTTFSFFNLKTVALLVAFFGFTAANAQYCIPVDDCTDGDLILNVEFAGIANPTDCSPGGYGDFTASVDPAEVEIGGVYTMSVEVGAGWSVETVGLWIDFDDNETFDPSEFYLVGTGSGSVVEADLAIPGDALVGTYRMRICVKADSVPYDDPCNPAAGFGEWEDYLVNVTDPLSTPDLDFSNSVTVFKSGENLNITSGSILGKVEVFDLTGKLIAAQNNIASSNVTINLSAANQVLLVKVQSEEGYTTTKKVIF
ncbi:MAG: GEVED domain-containing protein [Aequorivita antarctica]